MKEVSKVKVATGYVLLLAVLFGALCFVHREMKTLTRSDVGDVQWVDNLLTLLREKDTNTAHMLRTLRQVDEKRISAGELERIIARQDSAVTRRRVQRRVVAHRDTVVAPPRKKGFFRRLGEAFVPSRRDSDIQVKTSVEFATDTLLEAYNPADSLQALLQDAVRREQNDNTAVRRRKLRLQHRDQWLTAQIDTLLKGYETEALQHAHSEIQRRQDIRRHSTEVIAGIATGAVLLALFFLIIIGRDITRSNRYRRELELARRRAEELLATREKLMLAITHDFKAPLGSIMGYTDLLAQLPQDERQRACLDSVKASSEHLLKLVVDLLDFHRLDLHKVEVHRAAFRPARMLGEVRDEFLPLTTAKGLDFCYEVSPELEGHFIGDSLRIRQVIGNLLSNAVKFTERGGVTLAARMEEGQLVLTVADTGVGMDAADCERIFHEFTRLSDAQGKEGFGLGLSIVRMLVQLLEGTVTVDSVSGRGSTFRVCLPIYPVTLSDDVSDVSDGQGILPSPCSRIDVPLSAETPVVSNVLLIDDDRIQLELTSAMLSHSGIASMACLQIDELLEALRSHTFDVLLTDVQMPALDGFDLLDLLRASNIPQARSIPVIAVTARSDMQREAFVSHGFSGLLHKPFSVRELMDEVAGVAGCRSESVNSDTLVTAVDGNASVQASPLVCDFSALTAFSADDPDTSQVILDSFVSEMRLNADRLRRSLEAADGAALAAVAHKMLPLFRLMGVTPLVESLHQLEMSGEALSMEERQKKVDTILRLLEQVLAGVPQPSAHT